MRIRCPHCHHALEIVADVPSDPIKCPSCGSKLPAYDETVVYRREAVKSVGHFELLERVGRGHFGDVYRALDTKLDRTVAVKIPRTDRIDDSTLRLFLHEARAAAQLRHPNIVRVHDVNRDGEIVYIVSDFIHGVTLADRLESQRFEPRKAAELCATVADALHFAHEAGVVHRDLKPGNIMLDDEGTPYLMDFGLAKQNASEISITTSGDILGTPAYMSPEQARGDSRHADRRSDVYSLGVVLFQMVSGEHPFAEETGSLIDRVASDEPVPAHRISEKLPRDLATICLKSMSKDPARRYATAQDLANDLRRFVRGDPIRARRTSRLERGWRWARKNPAVVMASSAALAMSVLLVVALSWIAGGYGSDGKPPGPTPLPPPGSPVPRRTLIATEPPGATVVFIPLDEKTGRPRAETKVVAQAVTDTVQVSAELLPGDYLVVAYLDDTRFHEVYRRVPKAGAGLPDGRRQFVSKITPQGDVELLKIEIPEASIIDAMAKFEGHQEFWQGSNELPQHVPPHRIRVPPFFLDRTEYTVGDFQAETKGPLGPKLAALKPPADYPLVFVSYDDAVLLAERAGKRLPEESEYEFAATNGGLAKFPWGDDAAPLERWSIGPVEQPEFVLRDKPRAVFGLYSNAAEWTSSWPSPYPAQRILGLPEFERAAIERVVRGGSIVLVERGAATGAELAAGPRARFSLDRLSVLPGLGFRGARSAKPRLQPDDFARPTDTSANRAEINP